MGKVKEEELDFGCVAGGAGRRRPGAGRRHFDLRMRRQSASRAARISGLNVRLHPHQAIIRMKYLVHLWI
jgi:hypothetical protein